jgi:acetyl esterase
LPLLNLYKLDRDRWHYLPAAKMSGYGKVVRLGIETGLPGAQAHDLDPAAGRVIELLSSGKPTINYHIAQARRRYAVSRMPLMAEREPVEDVIHVRAPLDKTPPLTIFRPRGAISGVKIPALVYLHGGGWTLGGLDTYEPLCRQLANATGRALIWVEYRLAPEHPFPAALEDTWKALAWIEANAEWLGIERDQIAIGGDSAGGNIAAVTALAARDKLIAFRPEAQVLIYPCLDLTASQASHRELAEGFVLTREVYAWYRRNYQGADGNPMDWRLSPLFAESLRGVAPAVLLYAGFDPLRDEAVVYAARLRDAGVPVTPLFYPGMIHGFMGMGGAIPAAGEAVAQIASALDILLCGRDERRVKRLVSVARQFNPATISPD